MLRLFVNQVLEWKKSSSVLDIYRTLNQIAMHSASKDAHTTREQFKQEAGSQEGHHDQSMGRHTHGRVHGRHCEDHKMWLFFLKNMTRFTLTANSLRLADLVDKRISLANAFSLLLIQAMFSSVQSGEYLEGKFVSRIKFPGWLDEIQRRSSWPLPAYPYIWFASIRTPRLRIVLHAVHSGAFKAEGDDWRA